MNCTHPCAAAARPRACRVLGSCGECLRSLASISVQSRGTGPLCWHHHHMHPLRPLAGSMGSPFNQYYYDSYGVQQEVPEEGMCNI